MPRNKSEKSDPPVVRSNGSREWYRDGKLHPSGALWGQEWAVVATMARLWNRIHHLELEELPAGWRS